MRLKINTDFVHCKPGHKQYGGFAWIGTPDASWSTKAIGIDKRLITNSDEFIDVEMSGFRKKPTPHYEYHGVYRIHSTWIRKWVEKYAYFYDSKNKKEVAMIPIHLFRRQTERKYEEMKQEAKEQTYEEYCLQEGILKRDEEGRLVTGDLDQHEYKKAVERYKGAKK